MDICHKLDPDCRACNKPVYWKKRIFYLNRLWHLDCFKCSKCKIKLNTDVDIDDEKYSKAFLGEDYALRCLKCNNIFEQKKLAKLKYNKSNILNCYENELKDMNNLDHHYLEYDKCLNSKDNQHINYCKNHQQIHPNHPNHIDTKLNIENDDDFLKFINQHKCIGNCKKHKYLKDQLNNYEKQLNKSISSSEICKPLSRNVNLKDKKCNCTGCIEHLKKLKIN